jgi:copper chaperone CopZ
MISTTFVVTGMTCGHCTAAVTEALQMLAGVRNVSVDLPSGRVSLVADRPIDRSLVENTVEELGFLPAVWALR